MHSKKLLVALSAALALSTQTAAWCHYEFSEEEREALEGHGHSHAHKHSHKGKHSHKDRHSHEGKHSHGSSEPLAEYAKGSGKESGLGKASKKLSGTASKDSHDESGSHDDHKYATAFDPWKWLEMALTPAAHAYVTKVAITMQGSYRIIRSNGIPTHATGDFPNRGNPNSISEQDYHFRVPKDPKYAGRTTPLPMQAFGVAINGVPFDPFAAEWWNHDRYSGWQYEAMYLGLGIDQNNAHVQPNGAYHYHGIPTGLLNQLHKVNKPVLIGYAADGFPIYGPYDYKDAKNSSSGLKKMTSSYRVKSGSRPGGLEGPGGHYDGRFIQDYEFVKGKGDLDDCNGRVGVTPEYPEGIYHYVITDAYPYIPRGFKGTPDMSFHRGPGPGGPVGGGGGGGGDFGPPGMEGGGAGGGGFGPPGGGFGPPGGFGPGGGGHPGGGGQGGGGFGPGGFGPGGGGHPGGGPQGGGGFGPPGGGGFGPPAAGPGGAHPGAQGGSHGRGGPGLGGQGGGNFSRGSSSLSGAGSTADKGIKEYGPNANQRRLKSGSRGSSSASENPEGMPPDFDTSIDPPEFPPGGGPPGMGGSENSGGPPGGHPPGGGPPGGGPGMEGSGNSGGPPGGHPPGGGPPGMNGTGDPGGFPPPGGPGGGHPGSDFEGPSGN